MRTRIESLAFLVVGTVLLGAGLGACKKEPKGLDPSAYCSTLPKFGGNVEHKTCVETQTRTRDERPTHYECMSHCVESSRESKAFTDCARKCQLIK